MTKVYCDTCIYIDALRLNKQGDSLRPIDDFAWIFFNAIKRDRLVLITSDHVFAEFKKVIGSDQKLQEIINDLELNPHQKIHIIKTKQDEDEARRLSKENFPDALHVVLAKRAGALFITTHNLRHFAEFDAYMKKHGMELREPKTF
jgi:predicted nucleic acid-binding protein